ncbi:MAG: PA0069 family radical SAM protein [Trueperaceae bacterium]
MRAKRNLDDGRVDDAAAGEGQNASGQRPPPPRGRGAVGNRGSRFDPLQFEPDPDAYEPEDDLEKQTRYLRDNSRSIISRNNSPDIPFDISLNPYRGCEHGCSYCQAGDTPILMADGRYRAIESLRRGDRIYGTLQQGHYRRFVRTEVLAHWSSYRHAYRVTLGDGTELIASGDHRFLTERGWKHVTGSEQGRDRRPHLTLNNRLLGTGKFTKSPEPNESYRQGYLCGMTRGDGFLGSYPYLRKNPAISRKRSIEGQAIKNSVDLRVMSIEDLGVEIPMFDITTGTGDFIADGVVSHNCYARPTHEYLGFSPGLDFERMIMVKEDAPKLLERELRKPSWEPKTMLLSGVTDPYQPVERKLELTRSCLEVLRDFRHPVSVITKNHLVTRDIDILAELAGYHASHVTLSITTLNEELRRKLEPRTSTGQRRVDAVRELSAAGIPVSVNIAPIIPGLNDEEIPAILSAAAEAGARSAHFILVRLPGAVEGIFSAWLEAHYPQRKEKVLGRLRGARGGKLNEAAFGKRMRGEGPYAESIRSMFHVNRKRHGLSERSFSLTGEHFRIPGSSSQPGLFES